MTKKQYNRAEKVRERAEGESFFDFSSVRFRTWLYFILMTICMLMIIWTMQIVVYKGYYTEMRSQDLIKVGDNLAVQTDAPHFDRLMREAAHNTGGTIMVFQKSGEAFECLEFANSLGGSADENIIEILLQDINPQMFFERASGGKGFCYITNNSRGNASLVYGRLLDGPQQKYITVITNFIMEDMTMNVLRDQFLIVTIICMVVSIVISFFISVRISRPITEFSAVARQLGKGNFNVKFKGNGFTEIDDLAETLNYATAEIQKSENLRRDIVANVSHDIRTPLTMVKAYAEMIRDISGRDEAKRTQHAQVIIDEADRLTNLVNDILDLSRLQSGNERLNLEKFSLNRLIQRVIQRFNIYKERDGYEFNFSAETDYTVEADIAKVEQVLYNLIGNAVNYTGSDKKVLIKLTSGEGKVRTEIVDTGAGMKEDELKYVWDRYYRVCNNKKRPPVGTGIGLSIVKNILELHKAQFGVESEAGKGTVFYFLLNEQSRDVPLLTDKEVTEEKNQPLIKEERDKSEEAQDGRD